VGAGINGSSDNINLSTGGNYISISGANDTMGGSGSVIEASGMTNATLSATSTVLNFVGWTAQSVTVTGAGDTVNVNAAGDSVAIAAGVSALVTGNGAIISLAAGASVEVNGSNDVINAASGDTVTVDAGDGAIGVLGSGVTVTGAGALNLGAGITTTVTGTYGYIGATNDTVTADSLVNAGFNGSGDTLNLTGAGESVAVFGANDTVNAEVSGDAVTVTGNNDTINAVEGATITLTAGDSGDTINLIGGSIVLGAGVTGITINGTGDTLSGPGAATAGPVTTTTTEQVLPGGTLLPTTTTNTPPVIYYAGDIADLVAYFEANPYLSDAQIKAVEQESSYSANLQSYLASANIYGSPNSLPSNILAMLDGYSAVDLLVSGLNPNVLSEETYIEQQFNWVENAYTNSSGQTALPTDQFANFMPSLTAILESTNASTENLVSQALTMLENGNAGAPGGSQTPLLDDTMAELFLSIAANPSATASTSLGDEVYTPGRSGHWQVQVNGTAHISRPTINRPRLFSSSEPSSTLTSHPSWILRRCSPRTPSSLAFRRRYQLP